MESNISTQGLLFQGVMVFNATFNNISVISSVTMKIHLNMLL